MGVLASFDEEYMEYDQESPVWVRRRATKYLDVLGKYVGVSIEEALLADLLKDFRKLIPDSVVWRVVRYELRSLAGLVWDWKTMARIACSLAGGYKAAKQGFGAGVLASTWPATDCLLRFRDARRMPDLSATRARMEVQFVACNSRFAGDFVFAEVGLKRLSYWARFLGVRSRKHKLHCSSFKYLVGCEVIGRLERVDNQTRLIAVACPPNVQSRNTALTIKRLRAAHPCPFGAPWDCMDCRVGFNQCARSCVSERTTFPLGVSK